MRPLHGGDVPVVPERFECFCVDMSLGSVGGLTSLAHCNSEWSPPKDLQQELLLLQLNVRQEQLLL